MHLQVQLAVLECALLDGLTQVELCGEVLPQLRAADPRLLTQLAMAYFNRAVEQVGGRTLVSEACSLFLIPRAHCLKSPFTAWRYEPSGRFGSAYCFIGDPFRSGCRTTPTTPGQQRDSPPKAGIPHRTCAPPSPGVSCAH